VQGVDVGEESGQGGDEGIAGQAPQPVRGGQPAERVCRVRLQVLRQADTDPFAMVTVRSCPAQQ